MSRPSFRRAVFGALLAVSTCAGIVLVPATPALAQGTTPLSGTVTAAGSPVAGATVTVSGNNLTLTTQTDAKGQFGFPTLRLGTYMLHVSKSDRSTDARVELSGSGANVVVDLDALKEIGRVAIARSAPAVRQGGTDVTLTSELLRRNPKAGNLGELLTQLPGAARGANGVVHINGDHGDINYIVDGVSLPQEINRVIGNEFDPSNIGFAEILQGAYPAQYGDRFASVVNISTRADSGPGGYRALFRGGAFNVYDSTMSFHVPLANGGSIVTALRNQRDDRALDPPNSSALHDSGSNSGQFVRITIPRGGDFVNFTATHSLQTYQIPVDLAAGAPAKLDDNEKQDDLFASLQYHHAIGTRGSLSFGPSFKRSRLRDLPDPRNDFAYGIANGGTADCTADVTTCTVAVLADRTSSDYRFNADYSLRSAHHEVRAGGVAGLTTISKLYAVTLQPANPLAAAGMSSTVVDTAPNTGHSQSLYLQDSWRMGTGWEMDYGVRADAFQLASNEFRNAFFQVSPRLKITRFFTPRSSAYAYFGRFFTPFSFENISPRAAAVLQPASGSFDLLPQRDSVLEAGGHVPFSRGTLGLRVMQKNATDLIDDTQVGVTNLHQDINFKLGRIAAQSLYYQQPLPRSGRFTFSATHTYSVVKNCETQLLAPCASGPTLDWSPADHDQRVALNTGLLVNDRRNGWFAMNGEYGSGLTTHSGSPGDLCTAALAGCKVPPHLTFDFEKGFALNSRASLALAVNNAFNDRYQVTFRNAQGNHYVRPRSVELKLEFGNR